MPKQPVASAAAAGTATKREKRTITEIRGSKKIGEKMVYMSVPDKKARSPTTSFPMA
jgi:hypothetical protein